MMAVTPEYDDLRNALYDFCEKNSCFSCVLHTPEFKCGRGTHFKRNWGDRNMTDEQIIDAYELAIGPIKTKIENNQISPPSNDDLIALLGGVYL